MLLRSGRALLVLALVLGVTPAWAASEISAEAQRRARIHYNQGKAAFEFGKFQEALEHYKTAYRIAPLPGLLFNIGQCHRNLDNPEQAIFAFRLYLRKRPEAANREAVLRLIDELEHKLSEAQVKPEGETKIPAYVPESHPYTEPPPPPPPQPARTTPLYKRWWVWTLAGAVVAGAAVGIYLGSRAQGPDIPSSTLGVWDVSAPH
jgi:tetratricopeptide (TPR) repeat protein